MVAVSTAASSAAAPAPALWTKQRDSWLLALFALSSVIKLLLIPSYHSTDFEVHRNWMAVTASLPFSQWYYEATSQWTLDYPPLFAWFEWALSLFARLFDSGMLHVQAEPYLSPPTLVFQRLSVIGADVALFIGVRRCCMTMRGTTVGRMSMASTIVLSAGLFIVDHMHFQYNGFLLGLMLLSIAEIHAGRHVVAGFYFAVLLNLKHIFLYIAPTYFVYLLRAYCLAPREPGGRMTFRPLRFLKLGAVVLGVFAVSLGPFVAVGALDQVVQRLFPFRRGLMHAYWAANFWALYAFVDRVLLLGLRLMGGTAETADMASVTRGIVGDIKFAVLPDVTPPVTFALTLLAMLPSFVSLWRYPSKNNFVLQLVNCGLSAFVFGWHVHEKAILQVLVPMSLLTIFTESLGQDFIVLTAVGQYALFPLLFGIEELPIKCILWVTHLMLCWGHVHNVSRVELAPIVKVYLAGLLPLLMLTELAPVLPVLSRYQFLPLMLTSVYCAVGVVSVWARLLFVVGAIPDDAPPLQVAVSKPKQS